MDVQISEAQMNQLADATARSALYAADDESDRLIETFPPRLKEQMPVRGSVTGEERLARIQRNVGAAERSNAAKVKVEEETARNEAKREEQRAKNVRRAEEAENYQAWVTSAESRGGKKYEFLHSDCDLSVAQLAAWKVNAAAVSERKKALGFL